ncbi:phospholipase effector Tle1 domain-containing protein [Nocardia terpenica]|uniref:TIR domain-containing protein n=1 Tax=Nocardia terpenica TaxID=455432 RepID=A0A6G9Z144_9NOCA|nr:DUF2235 domain-containing protein [Nocardia terpenica]QIS18936.1 TIR domain-containing protein [Nocardia terpenica]
MSRIFVSHAHANGVVAVAVKQWLVEQVPDLADEIFVDEDPHTGIRAGQRWKAALWEAIGRCEAVLCLVSQEWLASRECLAEYRTAENLGKRIFIARVGPVRDGDITQEWQRVDLYGPGPVTAVRVAGQAEPTMLPTAGLRLLWEGLREAGIAADQFPWPPPGAPDRAPYRGWRPFDAVDAAVYFGRDTQILQGLDRLRRLRTTGPQGLFVVVGPSGAGKSSFLRAGLLPRLARDDRDFVVTDIVRPERNAVTGPHGLATSVHATRARLGLTEPPLGDIKSALTAGDAAALHGWLAQIRSVAMERRAGAEPLLVLPIDQVEEVFAADAGREGSELLELLSAVLTAPATERVPVVLAVTVRSDRFETLLTAAPLAGVASEVFAELKPMPPDRYREIIVGPAHRARAAGRRLEFEPTLIDRLLIDCREGADALPLLALVLAALYRDYGDTGRLTVDHYTAIGGIRNIVTDEISRILGPERDARKQQLQVARSAFVPWLATVAADSDQPLRRIARYADLPAPARPLVDRFVDRRLLVKDRNSAGEVTVQVAVESLLRQWDDLAAWLREEADDLRTVDNLTQAAADWERHGRDHAWLLAGNRLDQAVRLTRRPGYHERLAGISEYLTISREQETAHANPSRQLVVCCDGIWRSTQNPVATNITKIAETLWANAGGRDRQRVIYGNGADSPGYLADRLLGGFSGRGLDGELGRIYQEVARNWRPGDEIFIFGFGRGAYTARSLAGMINRLGLLTADGQLRAKLPLALRIYRQRKWRPDDPDPAEWAEFRRKNCHYPVPIAFLGVFDTAGAMGIPRITSWRYRFHDVQLPPNVHCARQALAIDERRRVFAPSLWKVTDQADGESRSRDRVKQVWFKGVHNDIGGGFDDTTLADVPLRWMVGEAEKQGLEIDRDSLEHMLDSRSTPDSSPHLHNSLTLGYRLFNMIGLLLDPRNPRIYWDSWRRLSNPDDRWVYLASTAQPGASYAPPNLLRWQNQLGGQVPIEPIHTDSHDIADSPEKPYSNQ